MEKRVLPSGNTRYTGELLGFNFDIEKADDEEFNQWLKAKLQRYILSSDVLPLLKEILGLELLEARIAELERILSA